ncbi:MAG: bis(5'-nucleosyl)-tetraphosphatase (symmetrical) YqeK [Elusimicrobiales bacterium]|jgi:nicotinate-nucleotide adenylyltransferase
MKTRQRIIIYGGTFDPPHKGHFELIRAALAELDPAVLYVVPGFRSPFKAAPCAPFGDRAAMLRAGFKSARLARDKRVQIHPYEFERGRLTYTWRTTAFFKKKHPDSELYFLMGSDCLETFHRWKHYDRILACARLVVGAREGFSFKNPRGLPYLRLKGSFPLTASTELKTGLFSGTARQGLFPGVSRYITRRGLYLAGLRRRVAGLMTARRFRHTLSVTRLALELAGRYGADPEKTALAGLLHDVARDLGPVKLKRYALRNRLKVPALKEILREAPALLHACVGAHLAQNKFGVKDRGVLNAIRGHTLGSGSPGLLAEIIFVADLASCDRDFPEAGMIRELAWRDLGAAYAAANYVKLVYAFGTGKWIHPGGINIWNSLSGKDN